MAANSKTPLQAIVSVICDCLADLPVDDQTRALEAARVTLGLRPPSATGAQRQLPVVEVQMMGDRPVVVNSPVPPAEDMSRRALVAVGPQRATVFRARRLLPPHSAATQAPAPSRQPPRGYVRSIR